MILPDQATVAARRRTGSRLLRERAQEAARMRVLATFNLDLLPPFLAEALARAGVPADVATGAFDRIESEILNPSSELYADPPDEVLLVPAPEDLLEPLYSSPPSRLGPADAEALVGERVAQLRSLVGTMCDRLPSATCYVVAYGADRAPLEHVLDPAAADRRQLAVERFTAEVRTLGSLSPRVVVVDWDWHVRRLGRDVVRDPRLWYLGRMRLSPVGCAALAELVARHAAAAHGRVRKVLALDFDGLLWGGVVGEAGLGGIELGEDGVGLAFQDLQRELVLLHDAGVVLVGCSKNNPDDAWEVFERHRGMVLGREQLAAERVNWQDKASNLRELAEELSLGLDSFVFLDDNPVERNWVREACPEVLVPELPDDPAERPELLRSAPWFARLATTDADRGRGASYREQRQRRDLRGSVASLDEFLASLEQEVVVEALHEGSLSRAAQLCARTNQFNLTTKRYAAADLERLIADPEHELFTLAVRDRFGDSGITGFAVLRHDRDETVVDTLLLSCRVLGRSVEDAFLAFLAERASARGASALVGLFQPTRKNAQVRGFYPDRGFEPCGDGAFRLELARQALEVPATITVRVETHA